MTYSKDYLTKREAFKKLLPTVPVAVREKWIVELSRRTKTSGVLFSGIKEVGIDHCQCCVLGALAYADIGAEATRCLSDYKSNSLVSVFANARSWSLNDHYEVPFSTFIKWIRESLKQPVK